MEKEIKKVKNRKEKGKGENQKTVEGGEIRKERKEMRRGKETKRKGEQKKRVLRSGVKRIAKRWRKK